MNKTFTGFCGCPETQLRKAKAEIAGGRSSAGFIISHGLSGKVQKYKLFEYQYSSSIVNVSILYEIIFLRAAARGLF